MKNTFKLISLITFSFLVSCTENIKKNNPINAEVDIQSPTDSSIESSIETENEIAEAFDVDSSDIEILDSAIHQILSVVGLDKKYQISYNHDPYKITGLFNNDDILDTAFIVKDIQNNKEGLIIRHGLNDPYDLTIFGAGKTVLNQSFDDFIWVGDFKTIAEGSKAASNVDEEGEIISEEIPDSLKTELPNDGIFIHASESCGGGIIYNDNSSYHWIQQE